jgi:3-hydroxyacyl-CoA dehydrogenase
MELVELCLPDGLRDGVRERALGWCLAMAKTAIEVPDQVGFVVNRLLFPYLFEAVRLKETSGMSAEDVDACMRLGAGHPMGPLKLLDFVGLDVAAAIGDSLERAGAGGGGDHVPDLLRDLIAEGKLGKKSGEGFFEYR